MVIFRSGTISLPNTTGWIGGSENSEARPAEAGSRDPIRLNLGKRELRANDPGILACSSSGSHHCPNTVSSTISRLYGAAESKKGLLEKTGSRSRTQARSPQRALSRDQDDHGTGRYTRLVRKSSWCLAAHGMQDRLEPTRRSGCVARAGECLVGDPLPDAVSMAGRPVHSEQVFDLIRCEAAPCFEPGVARPRAGGVAGEGGRRDERAGARHCAAPYGLPVAAGRH